MVGVWHRTVAPACGASLAMHRRSYHTPSWGACPAPLRPAWPPARPVFPARWQVLGQQRGGRGQGWRACEPPGACGGLALDRTSRPVVTLFSPPGRAGSFCFLERPLGADGRAGAAHTLDELRGVFTRPGFAQEKFLHGARKRCAAASKRFGTDWTKSARSAPLREPV